MSASDTHHPRVRRTTLPYAHTLHGTRYAGIESSLVPGLVPGVEVEGLFLEIELVENALQDNLVADGEWQLRQLQGELPGTGGILLHPGERQQPRDLVDIDFPIGRGDALEPRLRFIVAPGLY